MLARLPSDVCEILFHMDASSLNRDQVDLLIANEPTAEETEQLQKAQEKHDIDGRAAVWDPAEDFVLSLIGVPCYHFRLHAWQFENDFQYHFDTMSRAIR